MISKSPQTTPQDVQAVLPSVEEIGNGNWRFPLQNTEKSKIIPHMLAYVGIFLYLCALNCVLKI